MEKKNEGSSTIDENNYRSAMEQVVELRGRVVDLESQLSKRASQLSKEIFQSTGYIQRIIWLEKKLEEAEKTIKKNEKRNKKTERVKIERKICTRCGKEMKISRIDIDFDDGHVHINWYCADYGNDGTDHWTKDVRGFINDLPENQPDPIFNILLEKRELSAEDQEKALDDILKSDINFKDIVPRDDAKDEK